MKDEHHAAIMSSRFRGYLPVIIDVETGGLIPQTDALLEIAAVIVDFDEEKRLVATDEWHAHVEPFVGARLDEAALAFNHIDPTHPFRFAISESEALTELFRFVKKALKKTQCKRAFLVGHNAWFDLSFVQAAVSRVGVKSTPFHQFTTLDTAALSALAFGQTVLRKALEAAGLPYVTEEAHSAIYDATCTADLFCHIVNNWDEKVGRPVSGT